MNAAPIGITLKAIHRWLGMIVGTVLAVVGLSGTLLLFQPQFFELAHGELIPEDVAGEVGSMQAWIANAQAAVPQLQGPVVAWAPHVSHNVSRAGMLIFSNGKPGGIGNTGFVAVMVNPASGTVLGTVDIDRSPAYAPVFLHSTLWAGELGEIILSVVVVGVISMLVLGIVLWWPKSGAVARKLSAPGWAGLFGSARRAHDWVGIWCVSLLLLASLTGAYLLQPSWFGPALNLLTDDTRQELVAGPAEGCGESIGLDAAIRLAQATLRASSLASVSPSGERDSGQWRLIFDRHGSKAQHNQTHFIADTKCGRLTLDETPESRSSRETARMWLHGLHEGVALGAIGQWLVTALGIVPLILLSTGLRSWWRRRAVSTSA